MKMFIVKDKLSHWKCNVPAWKEVVRWTGTIGKLDNHIATSQFALVPCPIKCEDDSYPWNDRKPSSMSGVFVTTQK